jgi:drug/metabolite transporter (DMT)-like permease
MKDASVAHAPPESHGDPIQNRPDRTVMGIGFAIAGTAFFTITESIAKHLGNEGYPPVQLVFLRHCFALLPTAVMIWYVCRFNNLVMRAPIGYLSRAILGAISLTCFFYALPRMPLADVTALGFAAPLITSVLAPFLLKEAARLGQWLATILGFCGILIILRPSMAIFSNSVALVVLLAALCGSISLIITRRQGNSESFGAMLFYVAIFTLAVTAMMLPFADWVPVRNMQDMAMIASAGFLSGIAGICLVIAYRLAAAATVASFDYSAMISAIGIGLIFFDEIPDIVTLVGATIVIASGIAIIMMQNKKGSAQ